MEPDLQAIFNVVLNNYSTKCDLTSTNSIPSLLLKDLLCILDRLDSTEIHWHIARGLPIEYQKGDSIVLSGIHMEDTNYRQEGYRLGYRSDGKINVHKIFMDAPRGSPVILTDSQYMNAVAKKDELSKKYKEKLKKLKDKNAVPKPRPQIERICLICKQRYLNYENVSFLIFILKKAYIDNNTSKRGNKF